MWLKKTRTGRASDWLTIAVFEPWSKRLGRFNGAIVKDQELIGTQSQACVSAAVVVAELDFEHVRSQRFDRRAHLPSPQATVWDVYG
jgi:hypothetical protein